MPGYSPEAISNAQLDEIWSYLSSFPRPTTGAELYATFCQNCHGKDGRGGVVGESILGEIGEFHEAIRQGEHRSQPLRRSKYMPAYSRTMITDGEIWLLENFARDLRRTQGGRGRQDDDDDDDDDDHHKHDDDD